MKFKNVALMESHWGAICATLEDTGNDNDKRNAAMIREQLNGAVKVTATSKKVTFSAPRGGDLRDALAFWNRTKGGLADDKDAYRLLRDATVAHRNAIKEGTA